MSRTPSSADRIEKLNMNVNVNLSVNVHKENYIYNTFSHSREATSDIPNSSKGNVNDNNESPITKPPASSSDAAPAFEYNYQKPIR